MILGRCRYVITLNGDEILRDVDLVLEKGVIARITKGSPSFDIDCSDYLVIPALVDSCLDTSKVKGYDKFLNECLQMGVVGIVDFSCDEDSELAGLCEQKNIKYCGGKKFSSDELSNLSKDKLINRIIVFPDSIYEYVDYAEEIKRSLDKLYSNYVIPVSRTRSEVYKVHRDFGAFPIELLSKNGLLSRKSVLLNPGWITSQEINYVKESGASIILTPSCAVLDEGGWFPPIREIISKGIVIGLGSGACSSRPRIWDELKYTYLLYRELYWKTDLSLIDLLKMSTKLGFDMLSIKSGIIDVGYEANLILIDISHYDRFSLKEFLLNFKESDIKHVIVRGKAINLG